MPPPAPRSAAHAAPGRWPDRCARLRCENSDKLPDNVKTEIDEAIAWIKKTLEETDGSALTLVRAAVL